MKSKAIARLAITILAAINAGLVLAGINPIPISDELIYGIASYAASFGMIVWSWWKNAPFTKEAQATQMKMEDYKIGGIETLVEGSDIPEDVQTALKEASEVIK